MYKLDWGTSKVQVIWLVSCCVWEEDPGNWGRQWGNASAPSELEGCGRKGERLYGIMSVHEISRQHSSGVPHSQAWSSHGSMNPTASWGQKEESTQRADLEVLKSKQGRPLPPGQPARGWAAPPAVASHHPSHPHSSVSGLRETTKPWPTQRIPHGHSASGALSSSWITRRAFANYAFQ